MIQPPLANGKELWNGLYILSVFFLVDSKQIGKLFKTGGKKGRKRGKKEEKEEKRRKGRKKIWFCAKSICTVLRNTILGSFFKSGMGRLSITFSGFPASSRIGFTPTENKNNIRRRKLRKVNFSNIRMFFCNVQYTLYTIQDNKVQNSEVFFTIKGSRPKNIFVCMYKWGKNLNFCLYICSLMPGGGALKALTDMSARNVSWLDGSPYRLEKDISVLKSLLITKNPRWGLVGIAIFLIKA